MEDVKANARRVLERLEIASQRWGRVPDLVAVSKTMPPERINPLAGMNILALGENRAQEIVQKYAYLDNSFSIHCIGRLQTNKVKYIIDKVCMIQSLDRMELAQEIDRRAQMRAAVMPVLVQVNIGREAQKGGVAPEETMAFIRAVHDLPGICVQGLMCIMPHVSDEAVLRPLFQSMRTLFENVRDEAIAGTDIRHLSMGMSGDYELAAQEGATMVRVGSAIFGKRSAMQAN